MSAPPSQLPRIAVIGVSGYATIHREWLLKAYKEKRITISAFVAIDSEKHHEGAQELIAAGAERFGSYLELFEAKKGQLELCFIPTSIHFHARMTIAALKAGCHVLVEKPLAGSTADCDAVIKTSKETGHWVAVGFQDIYTEEAAQVKQEILAGRIGKIETISMLGIWPRTRSYYLRSHWAGRLAHDDSFIFDSPLNNALAHYVNLSLFFAGDRFESSSDAFLNNAQLYRAHDIESFDTAVVQATSEFGTRFWFGVSHASAHTQEPIIRIVGSQGTILWEQDKQYSLSCNGREEEVIPMEDSCAARNKMFDSVLERLSNPEQRICGPEIAICHTRLIECIHRFGDINSFAPTQVKETLLEGTNSTLPHVIGLEEQLRTAFERLSDLNNETLKTPVFK